MVGGRRHGFACSRAHYPSSTLVLLLQIFLCSVQNASVGKWKTMPRGIVAAHRATCCMPHRMLKEGAPAHAESMKANKSKHFNDSLTSRVIDNAVD